MWTENKFNRFVHKIESVHHDRILNEGRQSLWNSWFEWIEIGFLILVITTYLQHGGSLCPQYTIQHKTAQGLIGTSFYAATKYQQQTWWHV